MHMELDLKHFGSLRGTPPSPSYPMGMIFLPPFNSPWGEDLYHPSPLMGEFPMGNRGTGPR